MSKFPFYHFNIKGERFAAVPIQGKDVTVAAFNAETAAETEVGIILKPVILNRKSIHVAELQAFAALITFFPINGN